MSLGAQTSYRKAAALLRMFLPRMGGTTHTTTRSRVNAVGERIDEQIQREIAENRKPDKPADLMIFGIDGAFVKGRRPTDRASFEIIPGLIEADAEQSKMFAVVRHTGWPCTLAGLAESLFMVPGGVSLPWRGTVRLVSQCPAF